MTTSPPDPTCTIRSLDEHTRPTYQVPADPRLASSTAALSGDTASAALCRVLIGTATARWSHADIAALVDQTPGPEHVRTYRDCS